VNVAVHDGVHAPVAGATVTGSWNAGRPSSSSCVTATNGRCTVTSGGLSTLFNPGVRLDVTSVTAPGRVYISGANHDPDGDSNGTSIQVRR
jgi:hypothetical protein